MKDAHSWSYYITGGLGSGKSSFAAAMLREYRLHVREGGYVLAERRSPFDLKEGHFVKPYEFADVVRDFDSPLSEQWRRDRGLIMLDDVGAARDTPHVTEQLLHLLQYRYDNQLKTAITANLSVAEFAKHVDPRAASRLQEGMMIDLGKADRRRKQKEGDNAR